MQRFNGLLLLTLWIFVIAFAAGCSGPDRGSTGSGEGTGQERQEQQEDPANQDKQETAEGQQKQKKEQRGRGEENGQGEGRANVSKENEQEAGIDLQPAAVSHIVDGDTIYVTFPGGREEKVRFIGIDTPESTNETEPYGEKALEYTKKRLSNKDVWLEMDVEKRDQYGRLLAYIWMERPSQVTEDEIRDKMFNAELLLEGYAQMMTVPPNVKYTDYFKQYQRSARQNNKGLWGLEEKETESYYLGSEHSNKFHRPDCRWAEEIEEENIIKFNSKEEAYNQDYEPCGACEP